MRKLFPLLLLLTACQAELDTEKIDAKITEQLRSGPMQRAAFLTLEYGDSRPVVARKLARLQEAGTVATIEADSEGEHPLPSEASGFHLSTPWELKDLKWNITTSYHNDSLVALSLFTFIHEGDLNLEYQALRSKYKEVYGVPVTEIPKEAVFINGSQRVDLARAEQTLSVKYENTALAKRIFNHLTRSYFDKRGNSYDSTYYKQVVLPRTPVNPDKI
jgi:hypothetical protein